MSSPTAPRHLSGNYAPVTDEVTAHDLPVTGRIPDELTGWYLRNGPNPADASSGHWFFGDGMVHGVRLEGGRAVSYRNRWVRTSKLTDGARMYDERGRRDLTAGPANTHVVRHAGRTLALAETALPYELTPALDTLGPYDFGLTAGHVVFMDLPVVFDFGLVGTGTSRPNRSPRSICRPGSRTASTATGCRTCRSTCRRQSDSY